MRLSNALSVAVATGVLCGVAWPAEKPLRMYCVYHAAHGFRAVASEFQKRTGISVSFRLGCRDHFYPTVRAATDGDLYLTSSAANLAAATRDGLLASEAAAVGRMVPVIAVMKGNPHNIRSLADLARPGRVVAYPSTCIGKVALQIADQCKLDPAVRPNMTIRQGNRTGVLRPLADGRAHAALTWSAAIIESGRKDVDRVAIAKDLNVIDPLWLAILKSSRDQARAQTFVDFVGTEAARKILQRTLLCD